MGCLLDLCIIDHTTGAFNEYQEEVSIKLKNIDLPLPLVKSKLAEKVLKKHTELVLPASNRGSGPQANLHLVSSRNSLAKISRVWKTVHSRVRAYLGSNPRSDFFLTCPSMYPSREFDGNNTGACLNMSHATVNPGPYGLH